MKVKKTAVKYTPEEDQIFQKVLDEEGDFGKALRRLNDIFKKNGRTKRSVKEHLKRFLPENQREFTQEENSQLISLYEQLGPKWSDITRILGRTHPPVVRTQYFKLLNHKENFRYTPLNTIQTNQITNQTITNDVQIEATAEDENLNLFLFSGEDDNEFDYFLDEDSIPNFS